MTCGGNTLLFQQSRQFAVDGTSMGRQLLVGSEMAARGAGEFRRPMGWRNLLSRRGSWLRSVSPPPNGRAQARKAGSEQQERTGHWDRSGGIHGVEL